MPADFRSLRTPRHLANVTYSSELVVEDFLANPGKHLERVLIPRNDTSRAPREAWKITTPDVKAFLGMLRLQFEAFLRTWFPTTYPQACVHGYVARHSALTNARLHAGHSFLLHVDVKDFFPSIRLRVLREAFLRVGLRSDGAELLASVSTRDDSLPLGYPTSPLFSNLVLAGVDEQLMGLAATSGATYTRYADDLTFSSDGRLPSRAEIADILRTLGLEIHPSKSRQRKRGQALYVTGYSVSDAVPRAPRPLKRRLRQELYFIRRYGFANHVDHLRRPSATTEYDRILGQIEHVRHVEPELGDDLQAEWDARPRSSDGSLARATSATATPVVVLFDDSGFKFFQADYRALGVIVLREREKTGSQLEELVADFMLSDTITERTRSAIRAEGLHFNKLSLDLRRDVIAAVSRMPVRAHIVFDEATGSKKEQMTAFLRRAVKWRLSDCAGKLVSVVFEQGEYVNQQEASTLVTTALESLPRDRRPLRIESVQVLGKLSDPCLALPDIFLGAWKRFACGHDPQYQGGRERDELLFRTLQPRIGTIFNPSSGRRFTTRELFDGLEPPSAGT